MTKPIHVALVAIAALAGCTSEIQQERSDLLVQPIDCATATDDIAALAGVIPDRGERISSGARLVLPASLVLGAVTGENNTRSDIVSGRSEDELRARITEIDAECDNVTVTYETADPS
ncbi:MAG: hypothetical protein AAFQ64_12225 [Pseudomonadota bacterium]